MLTVQDYDLFSRMVMLRQQCGRVLPEVVVQVTQVVAAVVLSVRWWCAAGVECRPGARKGVLG